MDERSATPGQRLASLITRLVEHRRDHLELFQLLDQMHNSDQVADDVAGLIRQRRESFLGEFRQLIVEGQATGEVAANDPDQLVLAILATLEGLTRFGLHHPSSSTGSALMRAFSCACSSHSGSHRITRQGSLRLYTLRPPSPQPARPLRGACPHSGGKGSRTPPSKQERHDICEAKASTTTPALSTRA